MPGDTNNQIALDAFNQMIQAINDIKSGLETGAPAQTLAELVEIVGENIETFRTTFETRSIASTTAFNTKLDVLAAQLQALVNKPCCGGGGGCGGGYGGGFTIQPGSTSGISGGDAPTTPGGYPIWESAPGAPIAPGGLGTTEFNQRRCKVANMLCDAYESVIAVWRDNYVDTWAWPIASAMAGYLAGEVLTLVPVLDGVIGVIVGLIGAIALSMIDQNPDFTALHTELVNNRGDLVCVLYTYGDADQARIEFKQILQNAGATTANLLVMDILLRPDLLNLLWFKRDSYNEQRISDYVSPSDCSTCAPIGWSLVSGTLVSGSVDVGTFSIEAELNPESGLYYVHLTSIPCTEFDFYVRALPATTHQGTDIGHCPFPSWEYGPYYNNIPVDTLLTAAYIGFVMTTQITIQFEIVGWSTP